VGEMTRAEFLRHALSQALRRAAEESSWRHDAWRDLELLRPLDLVVDDLPCLLEALRTRYAREFSQITEEVVSHKDTRHSSDHNPDERRS